MPYLKFRFSQRITTGRYVQPLQGSRIIHSLSLVFTSDASISARIMLRFHTTQENAGISASTRKRKIFYPCACAHACVMLASLVKTRLYNDIASTPVDSTVKWNTDKNTTWKPSDLQSFDSLKEENLNKKQLVWLPNKFVQEPKKDPGFTATRLPVVHIYTARQLPQENNCHVKDFRSSSRPVFLRGELDSKGMATKFCKAYCFKHGG